MDRIDEMIVRARVRNDLRLLKRIEREWLVSDNVSNMQICHLWMVREMVERPRPVVRKRV